MVMVLMNGMMMERKGGGTRRKKRIRCIRITDTHTHTHAHTDYIPKHINIPLGLILDIDDGLGTRKGTRGFGHNWTLPDCLGTYQAHSQLIPLNKIDLRLFLCREKSHA